LWAVDGTILAMKTVDLRTVLETWDTSGPAIISYVGLGLWAVVYALAAARPSPRGRRWPRARTAWFIAGIALLVVCFASGLEVYEDNPTVHVVQHMLVMMAVPPLLVFGAPLTLLLRTLSRAGRRTVVGVLDDPAMRLWRGRWAGVWLCVDYYLTMYVYQLTPLRSFAENHAGVHLAVHGYFLLCGVMFWLPIAGLDPTRYRPRPRVKQAMVALGLPAFALLGAIELARGDHATGIAYIVTGATLTLLGQSFLVLRARTATATATAAGSARTPSLTATPSRSA
jgi:cytochrome c oxidase assembly factor CtaG